jgi:hypothetical protein
MSLRGICYEHQHRQGLSFAAGSIFAHQIANAAQAFDLCSVHGHHLAETLLGRIDQEIRPGKRQGKGSTSTGLGK